MFDYIFVKKSIKMILAKIERAFRLENLNI